MYQYSNEGYGEHASMRQDNPHRARLGSGDQVEPSVQDGRPQYSTDDDDQYPSDFETYRAQRNPQTGYHREDEVVDISVSRNKVPPKPAPKPTAYFQAKINRANRERIFSRQDSAAYSNSVDSLQADEDLSPGPAPAAGAHRTQHKPSNIVFQPRERVRSNQSHFDSSNRTQSPGDVFDRSQSAFSTATRPDFDENTLDRSTLSARGASDQNKSIYSVKSPTGSILVNRGEVVSNSANGNLNQSSLSTRSTTSARGTRNMIVSPSYGVYRVSSRNNVVSSRGMYGDANRSILSNHSVHSNNGYLAADPNRSVLSQAYREDHQVRTPTYMQNGAAHPVKETPLDATIRSNVTLSRPPSLNASKNNLFNRSIKIVSAVDGSEETFRVQESLVTLGLICLVSLVLTVLGTQLIYRLNAKQYGEAAQAPRQAANHDVLVKGQSYQSMLEVTVAICSFAVMLDICCLMVCTLQCYFAVKLLRCSQGDERCYTFLKGCAATRFIAVTGFFISIPALLLALLLYMVMEFRATPAIISVVILSIGLVFIVSTVVHSAFYWRHEKTKADEDIPPFEGRKWLNGESVVSQSELSTLV